LIMVGDGNAPVRDAGWPEGSLAVANLKTRVSWWEGPPFGGGEYHFDYRGGNDEFTEALTNFARILAPRLELFIHDEPYFGFAGGRNATNPPIDWSFTIWTPENWHRLFNNPKMTFVSDHPNFHKPVDPPRLDLYLGSRVELSRITIPTNVIVIDRRLTAAGYPPGSGPVIRVDVYDMATGKPLPGARLTIQKSGSSGDYEDTITQEANARGHLQINPTNTGSVRLVVSAGGYASRVIGYQNLGTNTLINEVTYLARSLPARGKVIDKEGKPVPGVQLRAQDALALDGRGYALPDSPKATTDAEGAFTLAALPQGWIGLFVTSSQFHADTVSQLYAVDANAEPIEVHVSGTGAIRVSILDHQGKPLTRFENAKVSVQLEDARGPKVGRWGGSAEGSTNGTYEFKGVPPGQYKITSRPNPGSSTQEYTAPQTVTVEPGKTVDVKMVYNEPIPKATGRRPPSR